MIALVTGGCGFVGSAVARALLRRSWDVRVLARPTSDRRNLDGLPVEVALGDLLDEHSLARAMKGCDALFHVAADYRFGVRHPEELYRANVDGTENVLNAARNAGVARTVFTSSVATLGSSEDGSPASEQTPSSLESMIGHYKRSKFLAEAAAREAADEDMDVVIVNPSTPIGPGDHKPTPTGRMVLDAASDRMPAYVDTGLNVVHVDDVAEGHVLAFERGRRGERYVLGGENLPLKELLRQVAAVVNHRPPRIRVPHLVLLPLAHAAECVARLAGRSTRITVEAVRMARKPMYFSSAKAAQELGYRWRSPFLAVEDAVAWFCAQGMLEPVHGEER